MTGNVRQSTTGNDTQSIINYFSLWRRYIFCIDMLELCGADSQRECINLEFSGLAQSFTTTRLENFHHRVIPKDNEEWCRNVVSYFVISATLLHRNIKTGFRLNKPLQTIYRGRGTSQGHYVYVGFTLPAVAQEFRWVKFKHLAGSCSKPLP